MIIIKLTATISITQSQAFMISILIELISLIKKIANNLVK